LLEPFTRRFPADRDVSGKVSIVGVGSTDYGFDYATARLRKGPAEHDIANRLAVTAFERALADSGLSRHDIDGLGVAYGMGTSSGGVEHVADSLGLRPSYAADIVPFIMAGIIPEAAWTLLQRKCRTFAMIFSAPMRSVRQTFGGAPSSPGAAPSSYYYHNPWGWSSQAAHWALLYEHYKRRYNRADEDLGVVPIEVRRNASLNPNAIMRSPITIDDYLESRFVVEPLRLLDLCLVSDGAVCLLLRLTTESSDLRHEPVHLSGWGYADASHEPLRGLVMEGLWPQYQAAGQEALNMAGISLADVTHFEGYDASTAHLLTQVEGYGFVARGEGLDHWKDGHMSLRGRLPVNTSGGNLSESYMQGWAHVVEAVRQLRGEGGARQISSPSVSMTSLATTDAAFPLVFSKAGTCHDC